MEKIIFENCPNSAYMLYCKSGNILTGPKLVFSSKIVYIVEMGYLEALK